MLRSRVEEMRMALGTFKHAIGLRTIWWYAVVRWFFKPRGLPNSRIKKDLSCISWLIIIISSTLKRGIHSWQRAWGSDHAEISLRGIAADHSVNLSMIVMQHLKPCESGLCGNAWKTEGTTPFPHKFCSLGTQEYMFVFKDGQKYVALTKLSEWNRVLGWDRLGFHMSVIVTRFPIVGFMDNVKRRPITAWRPTSTLLKFFQFFSADLRASRVVKDAP